MEELEATEASASAVFRMGALVVRQASVQLKVERMPVSRMAPSESSWVAPIKDSMQSKQQVTAAAKKKAAQPWPGARTVRAFVVVCVLVRVKRKVE